MRKITEKKENKFGNQILIGVILIGLMILSILGYSFQSQQTENSNLEQINYNGLKFVKQNDFWVLSLENTKFLFKYNPKETEKIESNINEIDNYYNKPLYIYSENDEAEVEVYNNLYTKVLRIRNACPENEICEENIPTKTCEDNFIIIKEKNQTEIIQEGNCVFIYGQSEDIIKVTDSFLFKLLGID